MVYFAHSREGFSEDHWQSLQEHLRNTGLLAAEFSAKFGADSFGKTVGLLHDIGKYSEQFQQRLRGSPARVDHSTAGAHEAVKFYGKAYGTILAYVIAGHHAGLPDYGTFADEDSLCKRLEKALVTEIDHYRAEIDLPEVHRLMLKPLSNNPGFSVQFFIRALYSCLVDADFRDTEAFFDSKRSSARGTQVSLKELSQKLDCYLRELTQNASQTLVNTKRKQILDCCKEKAQLDPGLFTLTVPTGGGKTLSSLAFALQHAVNHGMDRVIYIIPYTSIIEQNANVFRRILGAENVLEHHSNFSYPESDGEDLTLEQYRLRLATENWDAPIVVSTNVQFFESLFGYRSSQCRKIHNIANSVIILDEAQMLPKSFLKPSLLALSELVQNYHSSVVLCTATQPAIKAFLPDEIASIELAPDPTVLYEDFRRVQVKKLGRLEDEALADQIKEHDQVLCVVNTRKHAAQLFELLGDSGAFHLSALMYPAHRSRILQDIHKALKANEPCRVISTQLIEAGVDVDFPVVYRALSGIDSIAQAAGRCNREGRLEFGDVYIFQPDKHGQPEGWFKETAAIAEMVMRKYDDPLSLEAVDEYFDQLFDFEGQRLDKHELLEMFEERRKELAFPFREVAEKFKVIDQNTITVIIPREQECLDLLEEVKWRGASLKASRSLQRYAVQVYPHEFHGLLQSRSIENVAGQYLVLRDSALYSEERGLVLGASFKNSDILMA